MATYYVTQTGDDSTGDGSVGAPWRTIAKAVLAASVPTTDDHTVLVGPGTYEEKSSGFAYLIINRSQTVGKWFTLQARDGAGTVVITGSSDLADAATYQIRLDNCRYLRFVNLTFQAAQDMTNAGFGTITIGGAAPNHLTWDGCTITARTHGAAITNAVMGQVNSSRTWTDFVFTNCTINYTGSSNARGIRLNRASVSDSMDTVTFTNCTMTMTGDCLYMVGVTNLTVSGGSYYSVSGYGILLGGEAASSLTITAAITNATISNGASATGHALLVGGGCDGVTVTGCIVFTSAANSFVVKEAANVTISGCIISGGGINNALYFKAVTDSIADKCIIYHDQGACVAVGWNSTSGNKSSGIDITNCQVIAYGSADIFDWGDASEDNGGGICNNNLYQISGAGDFGSVYGTDAIGTVEALRAAWGTYDVTTNDAQSAQITPQAA